MDQGNTFQCDNERQIDIEALQSLQQRDLEQYDEEALRHIVQLMAAILRSKANEADSVHIYREEMERFRLENQQLRHELSRTIEQAENERAEYENIRVLMTERDQQYEEESSLSRERLEGL